MDTFFPWHEIYRQMIVLDHISVAEKMLRPVVVYLCLVVGLRLAGKRELAQMNPLDLIVLLMLSNTVQNAIIGVDNSVTGGLIGGATLLALNYLLVRSAFHHPRVDRFVNGAEVPLVTNGLIQRENLAHLLISESELRAVARDQGVPHLEDVETATLETSGTISILGRQTSAEAAYLARLDERLARIEVALEIRPTTNSG